METTKIKFFYLKKGLSKAICLWQISERFSIYNQPLKALLSIEGLIWNFRLKKTSSKRHSLYGWPFKALLPLKYLKISFKNPSPVKGFLKVWKWNSFYYRTLTELLFIKDSWKVFYPQNRTSVEEDLQTKNLKVLQLLKGFSKLLCL